MNVKNLMFGGSGIAGCYSPISSAQALQTLKKAYQLGIRAYDTAPLYGAGLSERYYQCLGPDCRVSTKAGIVIKSRDTLVAGDPHVIWDYTGLYKLTTAADTLPENISRYPVYDYTRSGIEQSFRDSLTRLNRPIHCIRLHDAETEELYQWAVRDDAVGSLVRLKEQGKVQQISLGMNNPDFIMRYLQMYPQTFDNIMIAGSWTLMDQSGYKVLLECQRQGVKVHQAGIFGGGLLWGLKYFKYQTASQAVLDKVKAWEELCQRYKVSLPAVAMAFSFLPSGVEYLCIGAQSPEHVQQIVALCGERIPDQIWSDAQACGLLANLDMNLFKTPAKQGEELEKLIHDSLFTIPNIKCLREQEIRNYFNDPSFNGVDHWIQYGDKHIFIQDKWRKKTIQPDAAQFCICTQRIMKKENISRTNAYLFWICKNKPTKNMDSVLKEYNVRSLHCDSSIESLARLCVSAVCETLDVDSHLALEKILVKTTVEHYENVTTPFEYDNTELGKQKKEEMNHKISEFNFIDQMIDRITNDPIKRDIENLLPKTNKWHSCARENLSEINYSKVLRLLKREYYPTKSTKPLKSNFITCCKFLYHCAYFSSKSSSYMTLRDEMIKSGSNWAKGLLRINACVDSITEKTFDQKLKMCSDYKSLDKNNKYWHEEVRRY